MMLNEYLKSYHFSEYHELLISQPPRVVFPLIKTVNFKRSKIINVLFSVRGLPKKMDSINGFIEFGFIPLGEVENDEIVLGFLFGTDGIKVVSPPDFSVFNKANYIKGVWNFKLTQQGAGTVLSTETRVHCPGKAARLFFSIYWLLISYFSGITRKEILKLIKADAESAAGTRSFDKP